jgi:hypothetical protein
VVDVDELDLDNIPLANTPGGGVAKRLRRNKGIDVTPSTTIPKKMAVSAVTETPRRTKTTRIGPKKSWSKVKMNTKG